MGIIAFNKIHNNPGQMVFFLYSSILQLPYSYHRFTIHSLDDLYVEMEKRNKIRDWETKRDDLNDKLDLCEEKLRNQEQDQRPDHFKDRLATAKVRDDCPNTCFFIIFRMVN